MLALMLGGVGTGVLAGGAAGLGATRALIGSPAYGKDKKKPAEGQVEGELPLEEEG